MDKDDNTEEGPDGLDTLTWEGVTTPLDSKPLINAVAIFPAPIKPIRCVITEEDCKAPMDDVDEEVVESVAMVVYTVIQSLNGAREW